MPFLTPIGSRSQLFRISILLGTSGFTLPTKEVQLAYFAMPPTYLHEDTASGLQAPGSTQIQKHSIRVRKLAGATGNSSWQNVPIAASYRSINTDRAEESRAQTHERWTHQFYAPSNGVTFPRPAANNLLHTPCIPLSIPFEMASLFFKQKWVCVTWFCKVCKARTTTRPFAVSMRLTKVRSDCDQEGTNFKPGGHTTTLGTHIQNCIPKLQCSLLNWVPQPPKCQPPQRGSTHDAHPCPHRNPQACRYRCDRKPPALTRWNATVICKGHPSTLAIACLTLDCRTHSSLGIVS